MLASDRGSWKLTLEKGGRRRDGEKKGRKKKEGKKGHRGSEVESNSFTERLAKFTPDGRFYGSRGKCISEISVS